MYIAHHVFPFYGMIGYRGQNEDNSITQQQNSSPSWDSSNQSLYEVAVTQFIGNEAAHYEVQLMVFSTTSMTEDEVVRMACVDIIRDSDNKYIVATLSSLDDPDSHSFDARMYRCLAIRLTDNYLVCTREQLPPVRVYDDNVTDNDSQGSVLGSLDSPCLFESNFPGTFYRAYSRATTDGDGVPTTDGDGVPTTDGDGVPSKSDIFLP